jgi:membrane protease YdiL (CAAX protease family)
MSVDHADHTAADALIGDISPLADIAVLFGAGAATVLTGRALTGDGLVERQLVVWSANIVMIGIGFASLRLRGQTAARFGLIRWNLSARAVGRILLRAAGAFVFALALFILGSLLAGAIAGRPVAADTSSYAFLSGNLPMLLLVLSGVLVASSFGEEWVYRGFLTTRLFETFGDNRRGRALAVAISSLIFGFAHYDWGFVGIVQTTLMGAGLAIAWLKFDRNLWVVILAHAAADVILMVQMYLGG